MDRMRRDGIIVKLMGGLGNQMFQYALGRRLSIYHGVPLMFDLDFFENTPPGDTPRSFKLNIFNIELQLATYVDILAFQNDLHSLYRRFIRILMPYVISGYIKERNITFDKRIFKISPPLYLDGYWQNENYFSSISPQLREDFTFRSPLNSTDQELANEINLSGSISVHIRRGDYLENKKTNQFHGVCGLSYYKRCADVLIRQVPKARFYIFSDNLDWAKDHLELPGPCRFVRSQNSDSTSGDFRLMSMCQHHIIANSSFSWWSAWLNSHPNKIVYAPRPWYAALKRDIPGLIPMQWNTMERY